MSKPIVFHYWFLRGRGEAIRLALNLRNVEYVEQPPDYQVMKASVLISGRFPCLILRKRRNALSPFHLRGWNAQADRDSFAFGQAPMLDDNGLKICQSNTIMRCVTVLWLAPKR